MHADPARYRQTLLDSVTDAVLEELTLRFARPEYPNAHHSGMGEDGGIDVLSDLELPPARAWQCKNHKKIDWDDCRESLRQAMSNEHPPPHYTFVFPRPLTGRQRQWWRKKFLPQQRALYPQLETLDFWNNLAERLNSGLSCSISSARGRSRPPTGTSRLWPHRLASTHLPQRQTSSGRPRNSRAARSRPAGPTPLPLRESSGEARADDRTIPDGRMRFGFDAPIGRPREFTATIRADDAVQENAAGPREDVALEQVTVW